MDTGRINWQSHIMLQHRAVCLNLLTWLFSVQFWAGRKQLFDWESILKMCETTVFAKLKLNRDHTLLDILLAHFVKINWKIGEFHMIQAAHFSLSGIIFTSKSVLCSTHLSRRPLSTAVTHAHSMMYVFARVLHANCLLLCLWCQTSSVSWA